MFDPLRGEPAPAHLREAVWHRIHRPKATTSRFWLWPTLSVGLAGLLLVVYLTPKQLTSAQDPLAETYITIDNPWVAHQPNELALLE